MTVVRMSVIVSILCAAVLTASCSSADKPASSSTPAASTSSAAADGQILNAATADLTAQLTKPGKLDAVRMKTAQGWAFLDGAIKAPDGQWIDYAGTPFAEAAANGGKSKRYVALLHDDGGWKVVDSRVGPTDVAWQDWSTKYSAPPEIFVLPPK